MSMAHAGTVTVRQYMNKVTSLLFDQAELQIVDVSLRNLRYVMFAFAYYTAGMAVCFAISTSESRLSKLSIYKCVIQ